jgi:hypothetical protein
MADWVLIYQIVKTKQINLLPLFYPLFSSISRSSSALHGRWIDDSEALEQLGWLEQPIAAARRNEVPLGRVGFQVSRYVTGVSCISRSRRGSSGNVSCVSRLSLEAQGSGVDILRRRPIQKSARPYIDLAPYRVCDLIKRQQN